MGFYGKKRTGPPPRAGRAGAPEAGPGGAPEPPRGVNPERSERRTTLWEALERNRRWLRFASPSALVIALVLLQALPSLPPPSHLLLDGAGRAGAGEPLFLCFMGFVIVMGLVSSVLTGLMWVWLPMQVMGGIAPAKTVPSPGPSAAAAARFAEMGGTAPAPTDTAAMTALSQAAAAMRLEPEPLLGVVPVAGVNACVLSGGKGDYVIWATRGMLDLLDLSELAAVFAQLLSLDTRAIQANEKQDPKHARPSLTPDSARHLEFTGVREAFDKIAHAADVEALYAQRDPDALVGALLKVLPEDNRFWDGPPIEGVRPFVWQDESRPGQLARDMQRIERLAEVVGPEWCDMAEVRGMMRRSIDRLRAPVKEPDDPGEE